MIIISKLFKISLLITSLAIIIPNRFFVYGTSDTIYKDTIDNNISINDNISNNEKNIAILESNNSNNIVESNIAAVLGIDETDENSSNLIIDDTLADYNTMILSNDDLDTIQNKFNNIKEVNDVKLEKCSAVNINIESSDNNEPDELVTISDTVSLSGPGTEYSIINNIPLNTKLNVTNIVKDGYRLLYNNNLDEWVDDSLLKSYDEIVKIKQGEALLQIDEPDTNYKGSSVALTLEDRDLLERLVMGEAGNQGYEGAALVAQTIHDNLIYKDLDSIEEVRRCMSYSADISKKPNDDVKRATSYIFDDGGYAVRHKLMYFYSPANCQSSFHESQKFIIEYGGHRFFSTY